MHDDGPAGGGLRLGGCSPRPIVVINTAHSGSRLLTRMLVDAGVHMGAGLPETMDCVSLVPLVEKALMKARGPIPNGEELDDPEIRSLAMQLLSGHVAGISGTQRWGWKLCETLLIVPLINHYFPQAVFVHLIRDGRDVAFSHFVGPKAPYWRKVYFGSQHIEAWRGFPMTQRANRAYGYLFNAERWRYHVTLARGFKEALGSRYVEVRYEDLVRDNEATARHLAAALQLPSLRPSDPADLNPGSIGKWRRQPQREIEAVNQIAGPLLLSLGYAETIGRASPKHASFLDRLLLGGYF